MSDFENLPNTVENIPNNLKICPIIFENRSLQNYYVFIKIYKPLYIFQKHFRFINLFEKY